MFITKRYTPRGEPLMSLMRIYWARFWEKWGHESKDQIENALERG